MSSHDVPSGWAITSIDDIASTIGGGTPSKSDPSFWLGGRIPWVSPKDMKVFHVCSSEDAVTEKALAKLTQIPEDSVLMVVRSGILSRTLPIAVNTIPVTINQDMRAFIPEEGIDARFLAWQLIADEREILDKCSKHGTTVASIEAAALSAYPLKIPPTAEQLRIVEKLDELLSDLDSGVGELKAAQHKLVQHQQSLLKATVEGALTADWRAANRQPHESGDELLQRILSERRSRWEQRQLAKFAERDKEPSKGWQAKYAEPVDPDLTELSSLPKGWAWASLDQLSEIQGGIQKQPSRAPVANRYPFLRVANVARGQLKLDDVHEIELFDGELERLALQKGDILIVEGNGSRTEIGRCALWDASIENTVHQNHLIRARPILAKAEFIETWLNSPHGIEYMTALAATTSGLYTLSVGKISKIPVPLPPLEEQCNAMEILASALAANSEQIAATNLSLVQAEAQRKNILKAAFAGKLVPQDPGDEPANVMLARIPAERKMRERPKARQPKKQKEIAAVIRKLIDVLADAGDWVPAQEVFQRCGVTDGAQTEQIEALYVELRSLEKAGRLAVDVVTDSQGRKLHDRLKLQAN